MRNSNPHDTQNNDELSQLIDQLLNDTDDHPNAPHGSGGQELYTPADTAVDEGMVFHNFSNQYGQAGGSRDPGQEEYRDYGADAPEQKSRSGRRKFSMGGCCGCGCVTMLLAAVALAAAVVLLVASFFRMPQSEDSIGERKKNTATILLCGTDMDGTRTDTMMLVYLDGQENRVGLLSLPRDTLTLTGKGKRAKLNSAYGRNGCGEEGMEWTMNYIQDIIGYRPDGYILVDMTLVPKVVDLMGGVDFHLDQKIWIRDIDGELFSIPAGDQHLSGREVLGTLRYRSGYSNADLGRVEVQRELITECMKQWLSPSRLELLPQALELIQEESLTDLDVRNFLWIGKTILTGLNNITSDTLPGYADMRGGASYFVLYPKKVAALINESYNPYKVVIDADDLNIVE